MSRHTIPVYLWSLLALIVFASTTASAAVSVPATCTPSVTSGTICNAKECTSANKGQTTLDGNEQNIIACLKDTSSATGFRWKAMTVNTDTYECTKGLVLQSVKNGVVSCVKLPSTSTDTSTTAPVSGMPVCGAGMLPISYGDQGWGCYDPNYVEGVEGN